MKTFHLLFALMTLTLISIAAHAVPTEDTESAGPSNIKAACSIAFKVLQGDSDQPSLVLTGCKVLSSASGEFANSKIQEAVNTYYLLTVEGRISLGEKKGQYVCRSYRTSVLNDGSTGIVSNEGAISKFHSPAWISK